MRRWTRRSAASLTCAMRSRTYGPRLTGCGKHWRLYAMRCPVLCDRCGEDVNGISRYPEGWLCDRCVAQVDRGDEDDDIFPNWDATTELLDDMRRGK